MNNICVLCKKPLVRYKCDYATLNDYVHRIGGQQSFDFGQEVRVDGLALPRYKFCAPHVDDPENSCVIMDMSTGQLTVIATKRVTAKPSVQTLHVTTEVVEKAKKYRNGGLLVTPQMDVTAIETSTLNALLDICQAVAQSAEKSDD